LDNLSPIVLFVYNRPEHTSKTLQSLKENNLAEQSELIIYSDAPKNDTALSAVKQVRDLIKNITGFKKVTVVEQEHNQGLATSIINGVTEIINQYGKVIVLEDDLVTSPNFLTFMNDALEAYSNEKKVWHVSGWNYPISHEGLQDTFLWRTMNCWGWATWADRWSHFEKDTDKLLESFSKQDVKAFNLSNSENFWAQVLANKSSKINTWAIYWYASIFKNKGLCLNPSKTYVSNIGLDGSGEHCGATSKYTSFLNTKDVVNFETVLSENSLALERIKTFYKHTKKPFMVKVINKVSRTIIKKNIIK